MLLRQFSYCAFMKTKELDTENDPKVTIFMGLCDYQFLLRLSSHSFYKQQCCCEFKWPSAFTAIGSNQSSATLVQVAGLATLDTLEFTLGKHEGYGTLRNICWYGPGVHIVTPSLFLEVRVRASRQPQSSCCPAVPSHPGSHFPQHLLSLPFQFILQSRLSHHFLVSSGKSSPRPARLKAFQNSACFFIMILPVLLIYLCSGD